MDLQCFPRILIENETQWAPKEWTILKKDIHVKLMIIPKTYILPDGFTVFLDIKYDFVIIFFSLSDYIIFNVIMFRIGQWTYSY